MTGRFARASGGIQVLLDLYRSCPVAVGWFASAEVLVAASLVVRHNCFLKIDGTVGAVAEGEAESIDRRAAGE